MKKNLNALFISAYLITITTFCFGQDGLILPMPGQNTTKPTSQNTKKENKNTNKERNKNSNYSNRNKQDPSGAILPMPSINNKGKNSEYDNKDEEETITINVDETPQNSQSQPLIALPSHSKKNKNEKTKTKKVIPPEEKQPEIKQPEVEQAEDDPNNLSIDNDDFFKDNTFPDSTDDFNNNDSEVADLLPPTTPETTITKDSTGEKITVFPKDTGAAVFMVMKSWNCQDYDIASLINQALEVYGKEAGEDYQIKGLENLEQGVKATVEEEDITFDELLDILASKTGNDWGCDISNKTIYVYPKGIKTESYVSWD